MWRQTDGAVRDTQEMEWMALGQYPSLAPVRDTVTAFDLQVGDDVGRLGGAER